MSSSSSSSSSSTSSSSTKQKSTHKRKAEAVLDPEAELANTLKRARGAGQSMDEKTGIRIGDVFSARQYYGSGGHPLGLYIVTSIGKQFVGMTAIESKTTGVYQSKESNPDYSSGSQEAKAVLPLRKQTPNSNEGRDIPQQCKFSYKSYRVEFKSATMTTGGRSCGRTFSLVVPNDKGEYVYIQRSSRFG